MKKTLTLFLAIFLLTTINSTNSEAAMFNRFKKGFYFEKYSTPEEAKEALLKIHPIGSNVDDLVKTLEGAGGKNYEAVISQKYQNNPRLKNMIWFKYEHSRLFSIHPRRWSVSIESEDSKILNISTSYQQGV